MPENEATTEEMRRELQELTEARDELADGGRYYLFDPDTAARHHRLTQWIEEVQRLLNGAVAEAVSQYARR
jgi:hypothetical protein